MRILIANRGEIARRIIRSAHRLGHETVAVFADPDRDAPQVREATQALRIGPAGLSQSYLSIERLLGAAADSGATALHPGYGFLAESAEFARAVVAAGLVWIGPHAEAIERMGSKIEARRLAHAAGLPIIPGYDATQAPDDLEAAAREIGFPVLVKAAAGGGGKGIRIAHAASEFAAARSEASAEAQRAFGDGALIVERFIERPRHIEVQIVGDKHGGIIELGTRECSVQRRYQKLLEEAPAPNLSDETRGALHAAAVALGRSIAYDSAGTVEFIVDAQSGEFFFLEMNTRLQVEHPVTECVSGLDLVELMIRVAAGEALPLDQSQIRLRGHAIEARINAEDPANGFAPQTGTVDLLRVPPDVRWDAAIVEGSEITPHYDPLVAKLIVAGEDRPAALGRLVAALDRLILAGLPSNAGFQRWLLTQPPVVEGRVTTRFVDEAELPGAPEPAARAAAQIWVAARDAAAAAGPWTALPAFCLTPHVPTRTIGLRDASGQLHEIALEAAPAAGGATVAEPVCAVALDRRRVAVNFAGHTHGFEVVPRSERWRPAPSEAGVSSTSIVAPFPAVVIEVKVEPGDTLHAGDTVVVIEAMKMLHSLTATGTGVVAEVRSAAGDQVSARQVLVTFEEPPSDGASSAAPSEREARQ